MFCRWSHRENDFLLISPATAISFILSPSCFTLDHLFPISNVGRAARLPGGPFHPELSLFLFFSCSYRARPEVHLPESPKELERSAPDAPQDLRLQKAPRLRDARPPHTVLLDLPDGSGLLTQPGAWHTPAAVEEAFYGRSGWMDGVAGGCPGQHAREEVEDTLSSPSPYISPSSFIQSRKRGGGYVCAQGIAVMSGLSISPPSCSCCCCWCFLVCLRRRTPRKDGCNFVVQTTCGTAWACLNLRSVSQKA